MSDKSSVRARLTGAAVVAIVAGGMACGAAVEMPAAQAHSSGKYIERACVVKAVTGQGLKGHGCDVYGVPHWVEVSDHPALPKPILKVVEGCITGVGVEAAGAGAFALVLSVATGPTAPVLDAGLFFGGCVTGIAEAAAR